MADRGTTLSVLCPNGTMSYRERLITHIKKIEYVRYRLKPNKLLTSSPKPEFHEGVRYEAFVRKREETTVYDTIYENYIRLPILQSNKRFHQV